MRTGFSIAWMAAVAVLSAANGEAFNISDSPPNIILILADDLGYGDLSSYGNETLSTPHLDRLAKEGLKFLDFHSNGAVCSPTRAALMTGRYPQRAGIPGVVYAGFDQNRHHGLFPTETTLAERLKDRGYRTGMYGKWHLGYLPRYNPLHHGFDAFIGFVSGNIDYHSHFDRMGVKDWWQGLMVEDEKGYSTHLITRHAKQFIRRHKSEPFFLYVAHEAPHDPYQGPDDPPIREEGKVVPNRYAEGQVSRAYREMIREMDRGIGEIVKTLKELRLEERTILFFMSDNGPTREGSKGPLRGWKGSLWEGGHRVPAIAWWPGCIQAGITSALACGMDLMPTFMELAGLPQEKGNALDGRSLVPLFNGENWVDQRNVFWEYRNQGAVRQGHWKLVVVDGKVHLFDLSKDLAEQNNLAEERPEMTRSLLTDWRQWKREVQQGATVQPERP